MRLKRQKPKDVVLPDELFVQPQILDQLAKNQDLGFFFYGESVYPPWKRQRKSTRQEKKFRNQGSKLSVSAHSVKAKHLPAHSKAPFTEDENRFIVTERAKGTTWEMLGRLLKGRNHWQVKKHYHQNLKNRPAAGKAGRPTSVQSNKSAQLAEPAGASSLRNTQSGALPRGLSQVVIPLTKEDRENKLYNKIVSIPNKFDDKQRPQLYFVLNFNEVESKCHLVPLMEGGTFKRSDRLDGKTKWKLVPEGEAEELENVAAKDCTIIKSQATNKVSDADKEAWQIFDPLYGGWAEA